MSGRKRNRALSAEETALWNKVVENVQAAKKPTPLDFVTILDPPLPHPLPVSKPVASFVIGQNVVKKPTSTTLVPSLEQVFANVSPNMDKRNFTRLKKGKMAVDGRIDLHGMTLAQAHPILTAFVQDAYADNKRLLLVITGKGKADRDGGIMPVRTGVLKHQVPQWLSMPPLSSLILQITQATQKHGGGGAYYVYLRRQR